MYKPDEIILVNRRGYSRINTRCTFGVKSFLKRLSFDTLLLNLDYFLSLGNLKVVVKFRHCVNNDFLLLQSQVCLDLYGLD